MKIIKLINIKHQIDHTYSLDIVIVVNDYSSWKRLIYNGISSDHHACVLMVHCLANRVKR